MALRMNKLASAVKKGRGAEGEVVSSVSLFLHVGSVFWG